MAAGQARSCLGSAEAVRGCKANGDGGHCDGGSVMKGRACVLVTEEEGTVVALGGHTFMHKIWESSRARAWHGSGELGSWYVGGWKWDSGRWLR
jgi:hypothetical protein